MFSTFRHRTFQLEVVKSFRILPQLYAVGKHDQGGVPYEANLFPHSRGYSSVRGFSARKKI